MHIPVLLQEVIDGLSPERGQTILDATVGGGGHSEGLCRRMGTGRFVCLDEDEDAIARSRSRLAHCTAGPGEGGCEFLLYRTNFRFLDAALDELRVAVVDRALFDLGMSSFQLEAGNRGFSFLRDEPLEMTFRKGGGGLTAREVVNEWGEDNIAAVISGYGEERQAKRIARAIIRERNRRAILSSAQLAGLIERVVPRRGRIHPATKTFQALRIAVNDELGALTEALPKAFGRLSQHGRMAVISFHSIEDRAVKNYFKELSASARGTILTKKPITAGKAEQKDNPRAHSAKLRIIEKISEKK